MDLFLVSLASPSEQSEQSGTLLTPRLEAAPGRHPLDCWGPGGNTRMFVLSFVRRAAAAQDPYRYHTSAKKYFAGPSLLTLTMLFFSCYMISLRLR
jgi:hypothetical protein